MQKRVSKNDQSRRYSGWTKAVFGGPVRRRLARWSALLPKIEALEGQLVKQTDDQLRRQSLSLRYEAKSGTPLSKLLPQAFALVREAGRRTLNMRHFDVQLVGGMALFNESIAEMVTGEGKTLTATLPLYLHALPGKGSHLATVNDYLARRDAEWMSPIYELLGMSVGIIESDEPRDARRQAYACDITYGTAKEFGFDFLRDQLLLRDAPNQRKNVLQTPASNAAGPQPVCRDSHFVLVDEADSILIDEARTPLIIGAIDETERERIEACYAWAAASVDKYEEDKHYEYDQEKRSVELTAAGRNLMRTLPAPEIMNSVGLLELYDYTQRAIKVDRDYLLDRHYVVRDGEIVIVDEFTGRLAEGRKWRAGIHQAIEAKEKVEVTVGTGQAARIMVQDLFVGYRHMAGMTGTGITSSREFRRVYKRPVMPIPTNRPSQRRRVRDRVFATTEQKWTAIVQEVCEMHELGRPVLIGTRSIDKSEQLSVLMTEAGIEHQVLNARYIEEEAEIVAAAGQMGKVTVATNMAGRGTDIKLGDNIADLGGLHVICTELHDARRIDRQLIGRCGRQGDPGTYRQYLALDDDILRNAYGKKKADRLGVARNGAKLNRRKLAGRFRRAQKTVEREHLRQREMLKYHEKNRKKMLVAMGQNPYLDVPD